MSDHDHKGYSEEKCVRCGWVMGHVPLNCQNNDTPHVFPSQRPAPQEQLAAPSPYRFTVSVEHVITRADEWWQLWLKTPERPCAVCVDVKYTASDAQAAAALVLTALHQATLEGDTT